MFASPASRLSEILPSTKYDPILKEFNGHTKAVTKVAYNSKTKQAVSCSEDTYVMAWKVCLKNPGKPTFYLGHKNPVLDVKF